VVTESVTIPVQREEVRLEQEPTTGGTGTDVSTGSEDVRRDEVGSGFGQDRPDRRDI
jgi:stress response protein YsnF